MDEWIVWVPSVLLALVSLTLAVALVRLRRRVDALEQPFHSALVDEVVVTSLVEEVAPLETPGPSAHQDKQQTSRNPVSSERVVTSEAVSSRSLFADLVLRESVVRSASFVHGVRRALAPETRNRIRFQMRQEVKRSRKQRRVDVRAAKRHLADSERAAMNEDAA